MRTRDIMTTPAVVLAPSASLAEASRLMARHGFTTLPVVDGQGRLLGLVSEDSLAAARFAGENAGIGMSSVAAVMRTPGVSAGVDLDVAHLGHRMAEARARALPVADGGTLVGMVTFQDVLRALSAARLS